MTDPKVAALAVDLGMKLGTDLVARQRRSGPLPWARAGVGNGEIGSGEWGETARPGASPPTPHSPLPTPLVPLDADELIEFTPTSADYRKAMREGGWVAVYIAGPAHALPTLVAGMQQWRICIGTTASPRDVKRIAQFWGLGFDIVLHALAWCEGRAAADRLKQMLTDALDYRSHHVAHRYYGLAPAECEKLLAEVARAGRIAVFDEAERMRRLQSAVAGALKRIAGR